MIVPFLLAFFAAASSAPPLERTVDDALAKHDFSGVVLIKKSGKVFLRKGYGLADREAARPNTPDTGFMLMSVSKQFTAALILRLAARGKLHLDDRVGGYLPDWPAEWNDVKIQHLLSHSAGLDIDTTYAWLVLHHPEYWPNPAEPRLQYTPRPLVTQPGAAYLYSNVGYTLLSMIASRAAGKPFDDLMRDEVFRPLGMTHTRPERGTPVAGRARGYRPTANGVELHEQKTIDIVGAGDLVSTVDDLAKWDEALDDDRFLPASLRSAMFTPRVAGNKGFIGYGWFLRTGADGRPMQFHNGVGAGFRAWNFRLPESHLDVIVLSNVESETAWMYEFLETVERAVGR